MTLRAMAAGAVAGAGLMLVAWGWLAPPSTRFTRRLAELYQPPALDGGAGLRARWRGSALKMLVRTAADMSSLRRDLALCGIAVERHAVAKLAFAAAGAALPVFVWSVWRVAGIAVPPGTVILLALVLGLVGFLVPDRVLARRAAVRRRDFRYALSLFLDLVVIVLAGGGGPDTALRQAAAAGSSWPFAELRHCLQVSRLQRTSPWAALRALGDRLGSIELVELAASVELAGSSGAPVRDSLRAKAVSVRDHELADAEAEALAAAERMGGPVVAMFLGLILLVGWPAMAAILAL